MTKFAGGLSFAWLYQRVQQSLIEGPLTRPSRLERWSFWAAVGMTGAGLGVSAIGQRMPSDASIAIATICLAGEVIGFAISMGLALKRELPQFLRPREVHAAEMDIDYAKWRSLVGELKQFSIHEREWHLRFVNELRHNMRERVGLIFGGIERLGIFPLLVALYLQFRDWKWGDWASAFDVNLLAGLIIWAMFLLYTGGWLLIGLRARLNTYASVLENSLEDLD